MSRVAVLLLLATLVGCATTTAPPPERQIEVTATSDRALAAGLDVLVERGFVIQLADPELGRVDAVLASRPGYEVRYETRTTPGGTQISLSGRQGHRPIEPHRFDTLLVEIAARLEAGS